ncbi:hypothetical protein BBJ29_009865 [Phytophthora kernoviae]|uniref:RxLR effector protein n=1 Tax=Phytophthora kernoviae TaxID=325452 RepID=A0A3F2RB82_9STRA|nr:hypothetical protein BBP00_00009936 [Phytophthora kernoviae]RLN67857.1 hypothetical protein BBJ29_009865 [Phytophthora kernoviae]
MNLRAIFFIAAAALFAAIDAISIDHDKVQPFPQPEPITDSEKAAVKFKPQLGIDMGCLPYPAVNAAGETSGGLKGTEGTSGCEGPPLGSQPTLETPKILAISTDQSGGYGKIAPVSEDNIINGTTPKLSADVRLFRASTRIFLTTMPGDFQDLIMWEQLTDAARAALDSTDFGRAEVPLADDNFNEELENAWPF